MARSKAMCRSLDDLVAALGSSSAGTIMPNPATRTLDSANQDNHFCIGDFLANLLITVVCERDGPCIEYIRLIVRARGVPDGLVVRTDYGFRISGDGNPQGEVDHE